MMVRFGIACVVVLGACGVDARVGPSALDDVGSSDDAVASLADTDVPEAIATDVSADSADAGPDVTADPCAGVPCDDGNTCTQDSCGNGQCIHIGILAACNDGNACTIGDACQTGVCLPGSITNCQDAFACTADSCQAAVGCVHLANGATCDDADPCTTDSCSPSAGCLHTAIADCAATCGDGLCSGLETAKNCPADCGFLLNRYAGPCPKPGTWDGCPDGFVCVARQVAAGGNICVADFETWDPIPDSHPATDYDDFGSYVVDKRTGLYWAHAPTDKMTEDVALYACTTETAGGFNDWRMPTVAELSSVLDYSAYFPATSIPSIVFEVPPRPYFTATPGDVAGKMWIVSLLEEGSAASAGTSPWPV